MTDSGQLTFTTMGGETVTVKARGTMGGETVTVKARGKYYVEPRGYAAPPGTGPQGETCKTCKHIYRNQQAKVYLKCALTRGCWTHGGKTDIRARAPACSKWEKAE